jgi:hypothetical protein
MRRIKAGLAAMGIAGAMATGVLASGTAHATTAVIGSEGDMSAENYTAELRYAGINQFVWQSRTLGPWVCNQRGSGVSEDALIRYEDGFVPAIGSAPYGAEQAVAIVMGGEFHFCPKYEGRGGRSAPLPPPPPPLQTLEPNPPGPPPPPAGGVDLNLGIPISHPTCDGTGIVVLGNAVTPGRYQSDVQRLLADNPGASYLRTDQSCPSLKQATETGSPIYAVFRVAGRTPQEVCSAVRAAGGNAYGKWLDTAADPSYAIPC